MWHDEGTNIYSMMGDGILYFLGLFFRTSLALFNEVPVWGYVLLFVVLLLVLIDRANIAAIVETSTDKSQSGTS